MFSIHHSFSATRTHMATACWPQLVTVVSEMPERIKLAPASIICCVVNICYGNSLQKSVWASRVLLLMTLYSLRLFRDPEPGFQIGTSIREAGRISCLHVYHCCLTTEDTETFWSYGDDLMSDIPQLPQIFSWEAYFSTVSYGNLSVNA